MTRFFGVFAFLCSAALLAAIGLGMFPHLFAAQPSHHILWGLTSALLAVSLHCLVFGIFTGSGKDTRLLVQDLKLNPEVVARTKRFKREVFPPALYAIGIILLTTSFGGVVALGEHPWARWAHLLLAWICFFYNAKVSLLEYRAIAENARLLDGVNAQAEQVFEPSLSELPEPAEGPPLEWETHVYALGKFLCFFGWNLWLPYIYLRFIVMWLNTPFVLFLVGSVVCLMGGYYLRWRYRDYRPGRPQNLHPVGG